MTEESANDAVQEEPTIWENPDVPIGDGPPLSRWPAVMWGLGWLAALAFLGAMIASRLDAAQ